MVGPTASGKSAWALQQAQKYNGVIVNCDSVQFYEGLKIGSAAPSDEDLKKVPHYLYSYVKAPEEMTAGNFIRDFYKLLDDKKIRGPIFVVGGTGFYIQALEKGMYDVEPIDPALRLVIENELQEKGAEALHAELIFADPASKIHVNDHFRLVRAIEILRHNGRKPSQLRAESEQLKNKNSLPFPYIKMGFMLEKEQSLGLVEKRTGWMVANGIIEETDLFLKQGFKEWAPLSSVGYREVVEYLTHNNSREWLASAINKSTMHLIKKQKTWFKRDSAILWSDHSVQSLSKLNEQLGTFLAN